MLGKVSMLKSSSISTLNCFLGSSRAKATVPEINCSSCCICQRLFYIFKTASLASLPQTMALAWAEKQASVKHCATILTRVCKVWAAAGSC